MLVTHEREKLIQAVNYFARHTRKFGKIKLYKLLYFLDFEHFKLTGRKIPFSEHHFSKREMMILKNLAEEYRDTDADSIIEATHLENLPWDQVYNKDGKKQQEIPYGLALRNDEREQMMKIV